MSIIKRALFAASLIVSATAAQAQQTGGAGAIGVDSVDSAYAQAVPALPRAHAPRTGFSGGANAIGVDHDALEQAGRLRVYRAAPVQRYRAAGPTSGAKAIGADN